MVTGLNTRGQNTRCRKTRGHKTRVNLPDGQNTRGLGNQVMYHVKYYYFFLMVF